MILLHNKLMGRQVNKIKCLLIRTISDGIGGNIGSGSIKLIWIYRLDLYPISDNLGHIS